MPNTYSISMTIDGPTPNPLNVHAGDKVTWTNNVGTPVELDFPDCVSPDGGDSTTVAIGGTTREETVNNGPGDFTYSYMWGTADGQDGTIDVS